MKKHPQAALITIALAITAVILLVRHFHIKDFRIIEPGVLYTSGQPRSMDYTRLLYKYHIATIINLRSPAEHREQNWYNEEITWVRTNGVKYIEMPIEKDSYFPDEQTQNKFLVIMNERNNLPVLLHGSSDDKRVAMLVAVWLKKSKGYTSEETIKVIRKIIDDRNLTEEENKFVRSTAK